MILTNSNALTMIVPLINGILIFLKAQSAMLLQLESYCKAGVCSCWSGTQHLFVYYRVDEAGYQTKARVYHLV